MGLILLSAPPQMHTSASPRATVRNASPMARWLEASPQVMVLDGAWASCTMVTWQASMLGRNFNSHSGVRLFMPSTPQAARLKRSGASAAVFRAAESSLRSAQTRPAPMLAPKRVLSMFGPPSASPRSTMHLVFKRASRTAR